MDFEKINADDTLNQGRIKINNNVEAVKGQVSELKEDLSDLGYYKRVSYTGNVWIGKEEIKVSVPLYFRPVVIPEEKTQIIIYGIYEEKQEDGYDVLALLEKGESQKIIPGRGYHHLQAVCSPYVAGEHSTFVFDYIQTDLPGIQTDFYGIKQNSAKTVSKLRDMRINVDTTALTFNIDYTNTPLIFTKNKYYAPKKINPHATLTLDYSVFVKNGNTIALVFNTTLQDYCLKILNEDKYQFNETDLVFMTIYFDSNGKVVNGCAIPYCNNLFIDGEELANIQSLADATSANETAIRAVQDAVASGHFSISTNGVILDYKGISADETYKIYVWNISGFKANLPDCYLFKKDGTYLLYSDIGTREIVNGTVIFTVTIPENAAYLRLFCNKQAGIETASCDWSYVRVSGARLDVIETKLRNVQENVLNVRSTLNNRTCNIFNKVVCCGDSYTSGHIADANGEVTITNENYAWPHYMSKLTGNNWINCGCSGCNVLTWQTHARGLPAAQAAGKAQAYVIALMINDASDSDRAVTLGTTDDIGTNAQTYYGGMSSIIRKLNEISPNAKIFVNTCPESGAKYKTYNQAVRDIVTAYKDTYPVHCIDLETQKDLYSNSSLTSDAWYGHYTAIGYEQFAEIYAYILSQYINEHVSEFRNVYQIEYDS